MADLTETPPPDPEAQLQASIASLGESIDRANLRLDFTRLALKELIGNDFAYLHMLAAIEAAVNDGRTLAEFEEMLDETADVC